MHKPECWRIVWRVYINQNTADNCLAAMNEVLKPIGRESRIVEGSENGVRFVSLEILVCGHS